MQITGTGGSSGSVTAKRRAVARVQSQDAGLSTSAASGGLTARLYHQRGVIQFTAAGG